MSIYDKSKIRFDKSYCLRKDCENFDETICERAYTDNVDKAYQEVSKERPNPRGLPFSSFDPNNKDYCFVPVNAEDVK